MQTTKGVIMSLKIEYVNIDTIKPYANNAKQHPQEQIEQIKKSIQEFGNNDPIAVWQNEIVEGHGRYEALKQLGVDKIPIIRLDNLTDEQRRAYTLVHNKLTMNSEFDFNMLDKELADLDIDMSVYGFEDLDINPDEFGTEFALNDSEKGNMEQITFMLTTEQMQAVREAMELVKDDIYETFGNENKNGNAIYEVVRQWLVQKKS
jgi:ParB-like chromosome segregation protein Spo0J